MFAGQITGTLGIFDRRSRRDWMAILRDADRLEVLDIIAVTRQPLLIVTLQVRYAFLH